MLSCVCCSGIWVRSPLDSLVPSDKQMASAAAQLVVADSWTSMACDEVGCTVMIQA